MLNNKMPTKVAHFRSFANDQISGRCASHDLAQSLSNRMG